MISGIREGKYSSHYQLDGVVYPDVITFDTPVRGVGQVDEQGWTMHLHERRVESDLIIMEWEEIDGHGLAVDAGDLLLMKQEFGYLGAWKGYDESGVAISGLWVLSRVL